MLFRLRSFRAYHDLELKDIAKELSMPEKHYQKLEEGRIGIDFSTAEKLSIFYRVPIDLFLYEEIVYRGNISFSNCSFSHCNVGYINPLCRNEKATETLCEIKDQQILLLIGEVRRLREQNDKILAALLNRTPA